MTGPITTSYWHKPMKIMTELMVKILNSHSKERRIKCEKSREKGWEKR